MRGAIACLVETLGPRIGFMVLLVLGADEASGSGTRIPEAAERYATQVTEPAGGHTGIGCMAVDREPIAKRIGAELVVGQSTISGTLSRDVVNRILLRHKMQVWHCGEQVEARPVQGEFTFSWRIDEAGRVAESQALAYGEEFAAAVACVSLRLSRWRFPEAEGPTEVTLTWAFRPLQEPAPDE